MTPTEIDVFIAECREKFFDLKAHLALVHSITRDDQIQVVAEYRRRFREWNTLSKEEQARRLAAYPAPRPPVPAIVGGPTARTATSIESGADRHARKMQSLFAAACSQAKARGIDWRLTLDEYSTLRTGASCHYCLSPLNKTGSALDRLDPTIGYVMGNVVPCCSWCNTVKGNTLTPEVMLQLGRTIAAIKRGGSLARTPRPRRQPRQPGLL
jgi:hypothetical protein